MLIRGNVGTRLAKVGSGELDAVVLACAGLARIGRDLAAELLRSGAAELIAATTTSQATRAR